MKMQTKKKQKQKENDYYFMNNVFTQRSPRSTIIMFRDSKPYRLKCELTNNKWESESRAVEIMRGECLFVQKLMFTKGIAFGHYLFLWYSPQNFLFSKFFFGLLCIRNCRWGLAYKNSIIWLENVWLAHDFLWLSFNA